MEFLEPINKLRQSLIQAVEESKAIKIDGIEDSKGYAAATKQRTKVNKTIKLISEKRLEVTRPFDAKKEKAIALERELIALITPEKDRIVKEIKKHEAEKKRLKEEEERKKQQLLQERINRMQSVNGPLDIVLLTGLNDDDFESLYQQALKDYEATIAFQQSEQDHSIEKTDGFTREPFVDSKEVFIPHSMNQRNNPEQQDAEQLIKIAKTLQGYKPKASINTAKGENVYNWLINALNSLGRELEDKAGGLNG